MTKKEEMIKLFRPVGSKELNLILDAGCRCYPERLSFQPIFYPVLSQEYAIEIAEKWNTKDGASGYAGYVTEFCVDAEYIDQYEVHTVGASKHKELWVPAEQLDEFNSQIKSSILISHAFYGDAYSKDCILLLRQLNEMRNENLERFQEAVANRWKEITFRYLLWTNQDLEEDPEGGMENAVKKNLLEEMKRLLIENGRWFFK